MLPEVEMTNELVPFLLFDVYYNAQYSGSIIMQFLIPIAYPVAGEKQRQHLLIIFEKFVKCFDRFCPGPRMPYYGER